MKDIMLVKFREVFGAGEGVQVYFAPGRVNLIGGGPCKLTEA